MRIRTIFPTNLIKNLNCASSKRLWNWQFATVSSSGQRPTLEPSVSSLRERTWLAKRQKHSQQVTNSCPCRSESRLSTPICKALMTSPYGFLAFNGVDPG